MSESDLLARLRAWSYRRQHLAAPIAGLAEALRSVIGVYSSHPTAPLSLLARSKPFTAADFASLEERREAIRIPAMRGSIFLVPSDFAARLFAATAQPIEKRARNMQWAGLDMDAYQKL